MGVPSFLINCIVAAVPINALNAFNAFNAYAFNALIMYGPRQLADGDRVFTWGP